MKNWLKPAFSIFLGGAGGGLVAACMVSLYVSGTVFGANWWDAMTAIGTVGATCYAAYSVHQIGKIEEEKNRRLSSSVLEPKKETYELLLKDFQTVLESMAGLINSLSMDYNDWASAFFHHSRLLCRETNFYVPQVSNVEWQALPQSSARRMLRISCCVDDLKRKIYSMFAVGPTVNAQRLDDFAGDIEIILRQAEQEVLALYENISFPVNYQNVRSTFEDALRASRDGT